VADTHGSLVIPLHIRIAPAELIDAWQPQSKRLLLLVPRAVQLEDRLAAHIELGGQAVHALVVGTVVSVHAASGSRRIELAPDLESLGAMRLLNESARGETVRFRQRPRRFLVNLPVAVASRTGEQDMAALNLSRGGCSLRWSGPAPGVGQELRLRLGTRGRVELRGVVCWWWRLGSVTVAGVRFVDAQAREKLIELLAELSGAEKTIQG
jgi:hypothetical protein